MTPFDRNNIPKKLPTATLTGAWGKVAGLPLHSARKEVRVHDRSMQSIVTDC
jgi:hypothetical protein